MSIEQLPQNHIDHMVKANPTYEAHVAINGRPELIEDPGEAYEVAHGTKRLEEKYTKSLGHLANYYERGHNYDGYYDPNSERGKLEQHQMAVEDYKDTRDLRIDTDKLGAQISHAYKKY